LTTHADIAAAIQGFGDNRRIYANTLLARSIEMREGFPLANGFEDVLIMARLLDEDWPRDMNQLTDQLLERFTTKARLEENEFGFHGVICCSAIPRITIAIQPVAAKALCFQDRPDPPLGCNRWVRPAWA
jgi:hypothetical protein